MFPRRVRPRPKEGDPTVRRRKRVKTFHTAEDQVIQEFQDILGHLRSSDIGGPSVAQYDGGVEEDRHVGNDCAYPPEDVLPEANLKSVPHDPSLQALWIAREIKKLAQYNERHIDRNRAESLSTTSPVSPTFSLGATNSAHADPRQTPDSSLKSSRSSGRRRRQTSKAKDSHIVDLDVDHESQMFAEATRDPMDGVHMLSALVDNQRVQHALLYSLNLGPGNFAKRSIFGTQFLQSMAADTLPPDPMPAAKLKHSLWRSRNHVPYFAALHILAGFPEVVQAIDVAFQGRLDQSTPLTRRERSLYDYAQSSPNNQANVHALVETGTGDYRLNGDMRSETPRLTSRVKLVHRKPISKKLSTPSRPNKFPGIAPKPTVYAELSVQNRQKPSCKPAQPESDHEDSIAHEVTGPTHYTQIDSNQSRRAIGALNGATAILDEMAYGALKYSFMPQTNGPPNDQYHTPYGPPGSNTYLAPYTNPSSSHQQQVIAGPMAPQQSLPRPLLIRPNAAHDLEILDESRGLNECSADAHDMGQGKLISKSKGKGKVQESVPVPNHISEPTETANKIAEATNLTGDVSNQEDGDEDDDYAQIDSFLALAAGNHSDSDDETDRDRTISREMTPFAHFPADLALGSIVRGITGELTTNQNWGHGIGFLAPQTHLYQISNAHRFSEGLTRCVDDARVSVNCVLSAEHSRAQEAFYHALIKRITNPYIEGTLPHYSNVVYHNGRAYQAIPGPAHPMYQQQLPYPPPPPPSAQMILPSQNHLPMTLPVDPAHHVSSSRPTSSGQTLRIFRQFANERPALAAAPPRILPKRTSGDFERFDHYSRIAPRPEAPHDYESSESDYASIYVTSPPRPPNRKRAME